MERITETIVKKAFERLMGEWEAAGVDTSGYTLETGSKMYGYTNKLKNGGRVIHLGYTKREAYDMLHAMANGAEIVNASRS